MSAGGLQRYSPRAIIMAALLAVHLFILIPVTLYLGNAEEFGTPLIGLLKLCLIPALLLFMLLALVARVLHADANGRYVSLLAALGVLVWLQATVMVWDYGVLDGRDIDWRVAAWRGWLDSSLWLIGMGSAVLLHRIIGARLYQIGVLVFVTHLIAVCYAGVTAASAISDGNTVVFKGSLEEALKFSPESNVLHLVVDGFQADVFEEILEHEVLGDIYRTEFSGFVFYKEALSAFPYTQFSVPSFLSGAIYDNTTEKDAYVDAVLSGRNIINAAANRGFEVDVLTGGSYLTRRFANTRHTNIANINSIDVLLPQKDTAKLIDLSLFRVVPHFLKRAVYNHQKWLVSQILYASEEMNLNYFIHTDFLQRFTKQMSAIRSAPVYKYIHVQNTHRPMVVDGDCKYASVVLADVRANLGNQSKCTLDTIMQLFQRMKALQIYDNTLILIHGDHGGWVPNRRPGQPIVFANGLQAGHTVSSLASPLLAIKPPGATGEFATSPALVSLTDIPDTISDVMQWDIRFDHRSILQIEPDERRTRRFYYYGWRRNEWDIKYTAPIQEFIIDGSHYEVKWRLGSVSFPPDSSVTTISP